MDNTEEKVINTKETPESSNDIASNNELITETDKDISTDDNSKNNEDKPFVEIKIKKKNKKVNAAVIAVIAFVLLVTGFLIYSTNRTYALQDLTGVTVSDVSYLIAYFDGNETGVKSKNIEKYGSFERSVLLGKPMFLTSTEKPIHINYYDDKDNLLYEDICFGGYSLIRMGTTRIEYHENSATHGFNRGNVKEE